MINALACDVGEEAKRTIKAIFLNYRDSGPEVAWPQAVGFACDGELKIGSAKVTIDNIEIASSVFP
jgi:hypothetical protein